MIGVNAAFSNILLTLSHNSNTFIIQSTNSVWLQSDCNRYTKVRGGRSSSAPLHKSHKTHQGKSESEEYDTLGSDSDTEVGTSSRTESSNHLVDSHLSTSVAAADARVHSTLFHVFFIYQFLIPISGEK